MGNQATDCRTFGETLKVTSSLTVQLIPIYPTAKVLKTFMESFQVTWNRTWNDVKNSH